MKNPLWISIGICMILAALLLAARTNSQDSTVQPFVAQQFATALHQTPTDTPTSTGTPAPTDTPTPTPPLPIGWTRVAIQGIQFWLPASFDVINRVANPAVIAGHTSRTTSDAYLVLYAVESLHGPPPMPSTTFQLIRLSSQTSFYTLSSEFNLESDSFTAPDRVDFGPFQVSRSFSEALQSDGVRVRRLVCAVKQGEGYWLLVYTAGAAEFQIRVPDFEKSSQTLAAPGRP